MTNTWSGASGAFHQVDAAVMVVKAKSSRKGDRRPPFHLCVLGTLYEVGFNHFFRGKADGRPGDHIYFQGHACPVI